MVEDCARDRGGPASVLSYARKLHWKWRRIFRSRGKRYWRLLTSWPGLWASWSTFGCSEERHGENSHLVVQFYRNCGPRSDSGRNGGRGRWTGPRDCPDCMADGGSIAKLYDGALNLPAIPMCPYPVYSLRPVVMRAAAQQWAIDRERACCAVICAGLREFRRGIWKIGGVECRR
jgi:hypothetical protein